MRRSGRTFKPRVAGSNPVAGTIVEFSFGTNRGLLIAIGIAKPSRKRTHEGCRGNCHLAVPPDVELGRQRFTAPLSSSSGGQPTGSRWARGRDRSLRRLEPFNERFSCVGLLAARAGVVWGD